MENRDLGSLACLFIKSIQNPNTARTFRGGLIKFLGWLQEKNRCHPTLADFSRENILLFFESERFRVSKTTNKQISNGTIAVTLYALSAFDDELARHYRRPRAFVNISVPEPQSPKLLGLSDVEYQKLIRELQNLPPKHSEQRLKLSVVIALETALRRNEITKLTLGQINNDAGVFESVYVSKKHPPTDKIITPVLADAIRGYLPFRAETLERKGVMSTVREYPLLISTMRAQRDNPKSFQISPEMLFSQMSDLGDRIGIHLTPHKLRHTTARQLINAGVDLRDVADLLGHKTTNTTMKYTNLTHEHRRNALAKRHEYLEANVTGVK